MAQRMKKSGLRRENIISVYPDDAELVEIQRARALTGESESRFAVKSMLLRAKVLSEQRGAELKSARKLAGG